MRIGDGKKLFSRLRLLSREELALWRHVTSNVLPRGKTKAAPPVPEPPKAQEKAEQAQAEQEKAEKAKAEAMSLLEEFSARSEKRGAAPKPKKPEPPALAPLAPLERRLKRQLSSGRAQVDDVIDLHGMTQAQAHQALNAFILRAAQRGARVVLVITGKGGDPRDVGAWGASGERGVLRRNTPHWLRAPILRPFVLSIEEAARPHGGAGALYVRLRRTTTPQGFA